jgi:hypothetical protein
MNSDRLPVCRHRGAEFAPGRWICASPRLVAAKGVTGHICRELCPCADHASPAIVPAGRFPHLSAPYGVAIGTFDSLHADGKRYGTEAVELNLAVLRANCGQDIKILVCDDASPPESQRRYRSLCEKFGAEFSSNRQRMGHTSGDMIVYHKALHWARRHRLATVTKLSHRMVIDVANWLHVDSERLLSSPYATQAQMLTNFGYEQIRTECVMMVVQRWSTSGVLRHYRPRRIPYWNESHTFDAVARLVDPDQPYPHFLPWQRISFERGADRPPVYFREMDDAEVQFRALAAKHGVVLSGCFSTIDSGCTLDYQ